MQRIRVRQSLDIAVKAVLLSLLIVACAATPAGAQIYAWRDAGGAQVFSDRPQDQHAVLVTFAVGQNQTMKATRQAPPAAARRFDDIIARHAASSGVSADLIRAVIQVESGFNPSALSPKGAQGLMQLMPATARDLGVTNAFHPEQNIRGGVAYLKQLLTQYSQDVRLALAAYNAGPASVDRYGDVPPYRETQAYVSKVTTATDVALRGPAPRQPAAARARAGVQMYKWIETVDGRPVPRYSNVPPTGRAFELVRPR